MSEVREKAKIGQRVAPLLARLTTAEKNAALVQMAEALTANREAILAANEEDCLRGEKAGMSRALLDRLKLTEKRIADMAEGLRQIAELPDPVGDELERFERPNGMVVRKIRVPIGLIGIIYEARPNVTVDAAGLCLKTGNAVLLRGGSDALSSNKRIVDILQQALAQSNLPAEAVQLVDSPDRASVTEMLQATGLIDVVIPRGGASLIRTVVENAKVPVIETGAGVCHTYIDAAADAAMAANIARNAKLQRPSVCNAMETLLVHRDFPKSDLTGLLGAFADAGVELRGCPETQALFGGVKPATDADYATEYNDYVLNVKVVNSLDEALAHIARFGTKHSECIVTEDREAASRFLREVDAAAVYHNVSTRFTDGFEFGFGAEIGISTQKLHARGPMGLPALTSTKYCITGNGQIRE